MFGSIYAVIASKTKKRLKINGQNIADMTKYQIKALQEGLGAIRDVLLDGSQQVYLNIYEQADRSQRTLQADNRFIAAYPRYILEVFVFIFIALLGGILVSFDGTGIGAIPTLGVLALGAQRLLPSLQQAYGGWSSLKGYAADVFEVLAILDQPIPLQLLKSEKFEFSQFIQFDDVRFSYMNESSEILSGITLKINKGERVGLIGKTGSGKSTLADLLMGLLEPSSGTIRVDGLNLYDLNANPGIINSWRSLVVHVPQFIFLSDSSVAQNIAFGVHHELIDYDRVRRCAIQACIHDFIMSMPAGYDSFVGEQGVRLSGGQRQRIGIARALYKQAQLLVLDEATSALDEETEDRVMKSTESLSNQLTLVMITHRLSTIKNLDRVIRINNGLIDDTRHPAGFWINQMSDFSRLMCLYHCNY